MTPKDMFFERLERCALIAILRGVEPDEVEAVGDALVDAGITLIEVPLNSNDALASIRRLSDRFRSRALIGAGTVLTVEDVGAVAQAGGQMIVSPNTNGTVIRETAALGLVSVPGYATPSEAFAAIDAGASALKLFPAEGMTPRILTAHRAVLPSKFPVIVVGGVTTISLEDWIGAGATGFGLGSALYRAGNSPDKTADAAKAFVRAIRAATGVPASPNM